MKDYYLLGKLNINQLDDYFQGMVTEDVIITDERMEHIRQRHPEDVALFEQFGKECTETPDLILKDAKNDATVFLIKKLSETNLNIVLKLALKADKKHPKNSVMTFYRIRERNLRKLASRNNILYKKESLEYNEIN